MVSRMMTDREKALAYFRHREAQTPMPGARAMYQEAIKALEQPEEDCDTCKHGFFGSRQCDNCRVRYPSHYESALIDRQAAIDGGSGT